MITVIEAPLVINDRGGELVFLAGSIEMGKATNWQEEAINLFKSSTAEVVLLNPRRSDWDSSWKQSIDNPNFKEQVEWERDGLNQSDHILVYLDPATKSPITLMEIGEYSSGGKMVIVCPEGFWRKGNVDILCEYHQIPLFTELEPAVQHIINKL